MKQIVVVATLNGPSPTLTEDDLAGIARTVQTEVYSILMFDNTYEFTEVNAVATADGSVGVTETKTTAQHRAVEVGVKS